MWTPENLRTQKATFKPFVNKKLKERVTQLWSDQGELINTVEYVNWGDPDLQFIVCDCGIPRCKSGDWVSIRRSGSLVLVTPALGKLSQVAQEHPSQLDYDNEYFPPKYLLEHGIICLDQDDYSSIISPMAPQSSFELLPPLLAWEAVKVFQFEAPSRILGHVSTAPKLPEDTVLASAAGDVKDQVAELMTLLNQLYQSTHPVQLRHTREGNQVISLYLDLAGFPKWDALVYNGCKYSLYLEPGYVIEET
jgi:hypothetical protein